MLASSSLSFLFHLWGTQYRSSKRAMCQDRKVSAAQDGQTLDWNVDSRDDPPCPVSWGELYPDPWILEAHSDTEGSGVLEGLEDTGEYGRGRAKALAAQGRPSCRWSPRSGLLTGVGEPAPSLLSLQHHCFKAQQSSLTEQPKVEKNIVLVGFFFFLTVR